jgi:putative zinc finger protein
MECRDVRELVDSFLAEELLTETNHEMLRHLDSCPACRADVAARRRLREALRVAVGRAPQLEPRPEFVAELRTKLQSQANGIVAGRRTWGLRWWALAATVAVAASVGFAYRSQSTAATALVRAAVGDHRNCALKFQLREKPISLEDAARRFGGPYRVLEQLPPADIVTTAGAARVLERHACVYGGRRFAHLVLRYRGRVVSMMVTAAEQNGPPLAATPARIDDMNVVSFVAGRQIVFIAGDVPADDLTTLAGSLAGSLSRELAGA